MTNPTTSFTTLKEACDEWDRLALGGAVRAFPVVASPHRASRRRLGLVASMHIAPLTLVAVLGQRADVLTVETAAALGGLAEQIGRAA